MRRGDVKQEDGEGVTQGSEGKNGAAEEDWEGPPSPAEEDFLAKAPPLKAFLSELCGSSAAGAGAQKEKGEGRPTSSRTETQRSIDTPTCSIWAAAFKHGPACVSDQNSAMSEDDAEQGHHIRAGGGAAGVAADRTKETAAEKKKREKYGNWEPDVSAKFCQMVFSDGKKCKNPFFLVNRRHHCRQCGRVICGRKTCLASELKLVEYSDGSGRAKKKEKKVCTICFQKDADATDSAITLAGEVGAGVGVAAGAATALSSAEEHLETIGGVVGAAAAAASAVPFVGAAIKGLSAVLKAGDIDKRTRRKCREVTTLLGRMEESAKDEKKTGRARYYEELEGKRKELEIVVWRVLGRSVALRAVSSFSDRDMSKIDALKTDIDRLITMGIGDNVLKNAEGIEGLGEQVAEVKKLLQRGPLFPQLSQRGLDLGTQVPLGSAERGTVNHKSDAMYEKARLKLQKAAAVRGQDAHRRELYQEVVAALTVALEGGISDDREERARFMLTHAHFEAGECFFKQRVWASARKHFEAGLGGHGLSDATEEHIRKYHAYCVYALGKKNALQDHQYEAAKVEFAKVLDDQHKQWLQRWNKTGRVGAKKDYVEMARKHLQDCKVALQAQKEKFTEQTEVVAWAERNQLLLNAQEMEVGLWLKRVGLEKYTEAICTLQEWTCVCDLQQLSAAEVEEVAIEAKMKIAHKKVFVRELKKKVVDQIICLLQSPDLAITTLRDLVDVGEENQGRVRQIFEEVCKKGLRYEKCFSEIKVAISFEGNSYTLTANCSMMLPASAMSHSFTKKLLFEQTRSARGNPVLQVKFDVDFTQIW
jgi:hypothetical protein